MGQFPAKICFISHNGTRTGAPMVLLHFVTWLQQYKGVEAELLFMKDGEIVAEFRKVVRCKVLPSVFEPGLRGMARRLLKRVFGRDVWLERELAYLQKFDLLFFNTVGSFELLDSIRKGKKQVFLAWLHEQPLSIRSWYDGSLTKDRIRTFAHLFCASSYTRKWLSQQWGVEAEKVTVAHPFAKLDVSREDPLESPLRKDVFIVGGCGLHYWIKAPDTFLQVARLILNGPDARDIHFIWVGGESTMTASLQHDMERLGLSGQVQFVGQQEQMSEWFNRFDVFLLPSRDDCFPLVALEAASFGKPVVCFEGIGDITEFVASVPSNVVPYGDVEKMAAIVTNYYHSRENLKRDGQVMQTEALRYDFHRGAESLYQQIIGVLS